MSERSPETNDSRGLAKRRLTVAAWALVIGTFPAVWAVGYQDHEWRQGGLAFALALMATIGAVRLHGKSRSMGSGLPTWLTIGSVVVTVVSLVATILWWAADWLFVAE